MKIVSIIALAVASIGLIIGAYCQIEVMPNYHSIDAKENRDLISDQLWMMYHEQKMLYGNIALGLGALGAVIGLVASIKKAKLGWIALAIGLISFFLGASQSTHMFS